MERDENLIEKVNKEVEKYIKIMKTDIEVTSEKLKPSLRSKSEKHPYTLLRMQNRK